MRSRGERAPARRTAVCVSRSIARRSCGILALVTAGRVWVLALVAACLLLGLWGCELSGSFTGEDADVQFNFGDGLDATNRPSPET